MASIISIHAPARGATPPGYTECTTTGNFNPRSREGSDGLYILLLKSFRISIHAPARGATGDAVRKQIQATISIHAPARGATAQSHPMKLSHKFQSTLPRGERLILFVSVTVVTPISIHAPARGATLSFQATGVNPVYFNPRSREGSDGLGDYKPQLAELFQSTLPRGERRKSWEFRHLLTDFNPRSREGSDLFRRI